jgi:hypothetical protein
MLKSVLKFHSFEVHKSIFNKSSNGQEEFTSCKLIINGFVSFIFLYFISIVFFHSFKLQYFDKYNAQYSSAKEWFLFMSEKI